MTSKRFKKLPEKTKDLAADTIEKLLPTVKKKLYYKIWRVYWFKFSNQQQAKKRWS